MSSILAITAPIFVLIALGYGAVRVGFIPGAWLPALGGYVIRIALPSLIFKSLSQRSIAEVLNEKYLIAYTLGSLLMLGVGLFWARVVRRQSIEAAALAGMGMSCSNSGFVGYPIALQVVGSTASVALSLCVIVENVVMIPLCLALADSGSATHEPFHRALGRAVANLRKSSLLIATCAGLVVALFHIGLPGPIARAVDILAGSSAPVALVFIGGSLVGFPLRGMFLDMGAVTVGKLVLHPLVVCIGLLLLSPVDASLGHCAVLMAGAPMLSIYPIIGARHGHQGFSAATLCLSTMVSFVTLSAVIWLLQTYHVFKP